MSSRKHKKPDPQIVALLAKVEELAKKPPEKSVVDKILIGEFSFTKKAVALLLLITTMAALLGYFRPVAETGAMPWPSRSEVVDLSKATDDKLAPVKESLEAVLEIAKQALAGAERSAAESRSNRIQRLIGLQVQLDQLVKMDPANLTFQQLLEQTKDQLASLRSEQSSAVQSVGGQTLQLRVEPTMK